MKKRFSSLLVVAASALVLTACASGGSGTASSSSSHSSASTGNKPAAVSSAAATSSNCRSMNKVHTGGGKNDAYLCSASAALQSDEAKSALDASVRVHYGSTGQGKLLTSRQTANAVSKTPDETCQRAFLSAVKQFQRTASKQGSRSVHVTSYYDKNTIGGNQYECHIGTWHSKVVLRGSV